MKEALFIIGNVLLYIFNLSGFYFIKYITQSSGRIVRLPVFALLSLLNTFVISFAGIEKVSGAIVYLLFFFILLAEFCIVFKKEFIGLLSGAAAFVFHILSARAIASSLIAVFCGVGIYVTQLDVLLRIITLVLTAIIACLIFLIYAKKWSGEHLITLYENTHQIRLLCGVEGVLLIYQLVCSFSYSLVTSEFWFVIFHGSSAFIGILWHYILTDNTIKYSVWLNQSFKTNILTEQLNRQLNHYEAYEKQFEGFRQFRADYDRLIGDVRYNISAGNIKAARAALLEASASVQNLESGHERYSNNMLVDSILWDTACAAQTKGIIFEAQLSLPEWLSFSELEYCSVFANLCSNALEAAGNAENSAFIRFTSSVSGPWLTIVEENTYLDKPKIIKGKLLTNKKDPELHGVGISSIKAILEKHDGFGEIELCEEEKTFKFIMHICKKSD